MNDRFRRLLRCFALTSGLRDAISHGCVRDYFRFKKYFRTGFARDDAQTFARNLSIVAIVKNEAAYIEEWIEFHKLVGVDGFFIYDNGSTDDTAKKLEPYIARGDVIYQFWPGSRQQNAVYNDALAKHRMDTRWMAFIDVDEFMTPLTAEKPKISDILEDFKNEVGFSMHWMFYGDSGLPRFEPNRLVIERFTRHAPQANVWMKTIVNPRAAFAMENHHGCFVGNRAAVDEHRHKVRTRSGNLDFRLARINHYWCKTWEEYEMKRAKGRAGSRSAMLPEDDSMFRGRNRNEVQDDVMEKYVEKVKENLAKTRG